MEKFNPKKMMHVTLKVLKLMNEKEFSKNNKAAKAVMDLITTLSELTLVAKNENELITAFSREAYKIIKKTNKEKSEIIFTELETKLKPKLNTKKVG